MADPYASLGLLKAQLTIADSNRDALLQAALEAASRRVDTYCGRTFNLDAAASARTYSPEHRIARRAAGQVFLVDDVGTTTGLVVETGPSAGPYTATTDYETSPLNASAYGDPITGLLRHYGWNLDTVDRLRVTARWGWPAVPDVVTEATLILATRLYRRKDSPEGVVGSSEWGTMRLTRTDPDVADLLGPLVLPGFA